MLSMQERGHSRCTTLPNTKHHTNTWACPKCTKTNSTSPNPDSEQHTNNHHHHTTAKHRRHNTKILDLADLINKRTIHLHISMLQDSKLKGHSITPSIGDNFSAIRNDRKVSDSGDIVTYIHKNISYIDTTKNTKALIPQSDKSYNHSKSVKVSTNT